ncbi:MAG: NAD(+)/NADH kinase [Clostridia bacterium]|nr:NAD(+)/NADH kinase [Clostridia bacterium]
MNFGVISNKSKDPEGKLLSLICNKINTKGDRIVFAKDMGKHDIFSDAAIDETDMLISMGGDGTFLNIARQTAEKNIPIMGVNTGSLGFLSAIDINEMDFALDMLHKSEYTIDERMMVKGEIISDEQVRVSCHALNDIVIARGLLSRIVNLRVFIDGVYVDSFPGDGVIVSTPTGSTGYSLSAGGPVVDHDLDLMVITPICPHILHAKSFIAGPESTIRIEVLKEGDYSCILTADGQKGHELKGGDIIKISKSNMSVKVVKIAGSALFKTLRNKIYYRNGDKDET